MKDQIDKPLDRAVYWIEYVIRHHGAPHLRTTARHLSIYQRGLLDVASLLIGLLFITLYIISKIVRYLCRSAEVKMKKC